MALPLQAVKRFLRLSRPLNPVPGLRKTCNKCHRIYSFSRSAFIARRHDPNKPNWLEVGMVLASTVAIWALILKDRNDHLAEYERRKAAQELSNSSK